MFFNIHCDYSIFVSCCYKELFLNEYSKTSGKSTYVWTTEDFRIGVDVNRGFALSPYLFYVVMDVVMKEIQGEVLIVYNVFK